MSAFAEGLSALLDPTVAVCLLVGLLIGTLVGMFPGVTGSMAVALAAGFTLTLDPVQGLAVLLTIYVGANYGDRIPAILVNTPGTPAAIATTLDGYPLAKQGKGGLALVSSAIVTTGGILLSVVVFIFAARPIASIALEFGPAEMFALVVFGLTVMISISSRSLLKGALAGIAGLAIATIGRDPITGDERFVFGLNDLNSGLPFIAVIIGLFGIAELFDQLLTHHPGTAQIVSSLGRWWPTRAEYKQMARPFALSSVLGTVVGAVPAAGGDIAGLIGWDRAKRMSKHPEKFGKGSLEGLTAADTASSATLGGSLTTTMALGVPGDSVMAVMLGSMLIWGLQPGPSMFVQRPELVASIAGIMIIATVLSLGISLVRSQGMVKILDLPRHYIWVGILLFCIVGTYTTSNNMYTVWVMLLSGVAGVIMKRTGFPPGPVVLGLLLGPLAESNLRRALLIDGPSTLVTQPIAAALLLLAVFSLAMPLIRRARAARKMNTTAQPVEVDRT
ncbi:tripartite tricarboxylate transporter permease [Ruania alba]|uniref:Putative tricarboxylic transport membrane protein n=1 Tax=Ruania alba TaxID=648782 RepID=A0A1H5KHR7_9MICO|nr:tripartite tricarboxylate transporter permease [Ruania alba]SEE64323.1 putative tricarboxylic transport membrane protein [Ruania alba]